MIYFYYGTDIDKARIKSHELADSLLKKKPDASFFKIDIENFDNLKIEEYIGGQGLFSNKYIVFLDRLCSDKAIKEQFLDKLKEIKESENIFIILEGKIDKVTAGKIEKKSEKFLSFDLGEKEIKEKEDRKKEELNIFEIANALARRNKKEIWIIYRQLLDNGKVPEEIHGVLFWKIKTMILSGGSSNWKEDELKAFADKLITIYHESRRGNGELETGLESLILCA